MFEQLEEGLFVCKNYWGADECKAVTDELAKSQDWKIAPILTYNGREVNESIRNQKILRSACEQKDRFAADMAKQGKLIGVSDPLTVHLLEYQITEPGGFFGWHPDYYEGSDRALSCLLYLSDAKSHGLVGGSTEFVIGDEVIEIEPEIGMVVLFDPRIIHRGTEVIAGTKYSLLAIHRIDCGCIKYRQLNRNSEEMVREVDSQKG